jgi:hypothetical protein
MNGPQTQKLVQSDWLKFEEDSHYSRENIVIKSGVGALLTGAVLGMIAVGAGTPVMDAGNTGNATFGAVTVGAGVEPGAYVVTFTAATKYDVEDPAGVMIGTGTTGVAFSKEGLGFTITAGGTPMVAGDRAVITVAAGTGKYVPFDPAGTTGAQNAVGILLEPVDDTTADVKAAAIVRHAHIAPSGLSWADGVDTGEKAAALLQLRALGILQVREV